MVRPATRWHSTESRADGRLGAVQIMSSLVIPLSELESARLTLLGGEPWARALFGRLLATPQPVVPYADVVSGSGYIPQHPADTSAATSTQQEILANTTYLRTLFAGTPKVIGNSGRDRIHEYPTDSLPEDQFRAGGVGGAVGGHPRGLLRRLECADGGQDACVKRSRSRDRALSRQHARPGASTGSC